MLAVTASSHPTLSALSNHENLKQHDEMQKDFSPQQDEPTWQSGSHRQVSPGIDRHMERQEGSPLSAGGLDSTFPGEDDRRGPVSAPGGMTTTRAPAELANSWVEGCLAAK